MQGFSNDPTVWFGVAFVIFLALVWRYGRKAIFAVLDGHSAKVKAELENAARIQAEAARLLETSKTKHENALRQAESVLNHAREEAEILRATAEQECQETLKRREAQALERIALLEAQAKEALRKTLLNLALAASESVLAKTVGAAEDEQLIRSQTSQLAAQLTAQLSKVA